MERISLADETTTAGHATAPTILTKLPVRWELDTHTGAVTANDTHAGTVIEIVPGLFAFETVKDQTHRRDSHWGMFPTPAKASEQGAIRAVLENR
ncbi:hypothetical protein [Arthrobacter castelli]|uniref:hypothetical protein n=1 Tax=Arthrobacter castelli TaxID=271431 RepID=UPI0003FF88C3|nr:hypothetical protein [Arthrobacter castelli]